MTINRTILFYRSVFQQSPKLAGILASLQNGPHLFNSNKKFNKQTLKISFSSEQEKKWLEQYED